MRSNNRRLSLLFLLQTSLSLDAVLERLRNA